ncbi:MAG: NAD(P)H-hydrate dehydratase [Alphaproteobacteria bacterium]
MMDRAIKYSIFTTSQMYLADSLSESKGKTVKILMENAGFAVASEIFKRFGKKKIIVLCGPGNNGGDGLVAARILKSWGYAVEVFLLGECTKLKEASLYNAAMLAKYNVEIKSLDSLVLDNVDKDSTIIIDALFGAGLSKPLTGSAKDAVVAVNEKNLNCVAVDVPSGVLGDTGEILEGIAVKAILTVTFCRKKPAHILCPSKDLCGEVVVADIDIDDETVNQTRPYIYENSKDLWQEAQFGTDVHKYQRGQVLTLGGYPMTGAARLASLAARRAGAGLTALAVPKEAYNIYAMSDAGNIIMSYQEMNELEDIVNNPKNKVILAGPGLGVSEQTRNMVRAIGKSKKKLVLDADALSSFATCRDDLKHILNENAVITPHEGELLRLFPELANVKSKISRAEYAAQYFKCHVVLKGADTIIASYDGRIVINSNALPFLATAGSGDVLAGIISSLAAQGMNVFEAASLGVWIHGELSQKIAHNLIAEDLINELKRL